MKTGRCIFSMGCFCLVGFALVLGGACSEKKNPQPRRMVGGPCEYKSYPGTAEVVSIEKIDAKNREKTEMKDTYDVRFLFDANVSPTEPFVRVEGEPQRLLLTNGSAPTGGFLKRYGITVGKRLPCSLEVIARGTCTPILFKFPTVDLADYEANE